MAHHSSHPLRGQTADAVRFHLTEAHGGDPAGYPQDRDGLQALHVRLHEALPGLPVVTGPRPPVLPDDPALTPAAFAGRASDAFSHALGDLAALRLVDASLADDVAARWAQALAVTV